jgi:superfamily II DNA helicase RecQ
MLPAMIDWEDVLGRARSVFRIREFRPGQRELLEAVLEGRHALGVLPTGGGKSLVFQRRRRGARGQPAAQWRLN